MQQSNEMAIELEVGRDPHEGRGLGRPAACATSTCRPAPTSRRCSRACPATCASARTGATSLEGSIHVRYADGTEEMNRAGDLYYWPGGHTGWTDEGVDVHRVQPGRRAPAGARAPRRRSWPRRADAGAGLASRPWRRADEAAADRADALRRRAPPSPATTGQAALDAARAGTSSTTPRARPTGSTSWPRRRGGSAGSTSASTARERGLPRLRGARRPPPGRAVRGVAVGAPLLQRPGRRSPAAGCGGPAARSTATRSASSTARCCSARPRPPTAPASSSGPPRWPREALDLGRTLRSADLEAEALQTIGRVLIDQGEVAEGMGHLDEAMLFAVEGRLGPYSTGKVYCSLISACEELGDLDRAAEWTEATHALGGAAPVRHLPGHLPRPPRRRAQAAGRRWPRRSARRRRPATSCVGSHVANSAAAYAEVGDIRRRLGDLDRAEEAFARAAGAVRPAVRRARAAAPRAGPRRRRHARSSPAACASTGQPARPRRRCSRCSCTSPSPPATSTPPAQALDELDEHRRRRFDTPMLRAAALLDPRPAAARAEATPAALRHPAARRVEHWQELDVPYEVATARTLLGQALRDAGDEAAATGVVRRRRGAVRPDRRPARRRGSCCGDTQAGAARPA